MRKPVLGGLIYLSMISGIYCSELQFVSVDFPPYSYETQDGGAGAMYDVVIEVSKRLGKPAKIRFMPWARARFEAENNDNMAILPLARTPEREHKYSWIIHILDDPYVLVALKTSKQDISSLESAKNLRVGVLSGSAAGPLLTRLGFKYIDEAGADYQNVQKLKLGRIDAWAVPYSCRGQYKTEGGLGEDDLKTGYQLTMLHEYLGGSKSLSKEELIKWQNEFQKMKRDGSYKKIMNKYGIRPLE